MNGRQRREAEAAADLLEARGVSMLLNEVLKVVENLSLALGEWKHFVTLQCRPLYAKERRRSIARDEVSVAWGGGESDPLRGRSV
jgi:hypothetical protein